MAQKCIPGDLFDVFRNCTHPNRSEIFFQFFGVFIGSPAAPWHTDSKNIYMSIANIFLSGRKLRKTSGKLQFLHNCKFPEVFGHFRPLRKIFAIDIYIFLESVRQGTTGKPIKTPKN